MILGDGVASADRLIAGVLAGGGVEKFWKAGVLLLRLTETLLSSS